MAEHTVVCGFDGIAIRIVEELQALDEQVVVVVGDPACDLALRARALGIECIEGDYRDPDTLIAAGIEGAGGLAIVNAQDEGNLQSALAAQQLNPDVRLAVRMFDTQVGRRLEDLFSNCRIISTSAVAAPAFAAAARFGNSGQCFSIREKTLQFRPIESGDEVIVRLAAEDEHGALHLFREEGRPYGLVATQEEEVRPAAPTAFQSASWASAWKARVKALRDLIDRRLLYAFAFLIAVGAVSTAFFGITSGLDPIDALYFTVTTVSTVGYGDISPRSYGSAVEVYTIVLMIVSSLTLVIFYALFTDVIVGARLARTLGTYPAPQRDHVVICGVGSIGYRVVAELVARGVPCVAIERDENSRFLAATRRLKVPVIIDDATRHGVLAHLHLDQARALMALTEHDLANLQIALAARDIAPELRVVPRIFDASFAESIENAFGIHTSRSVAGLAAPAFVDALMKRRFLATVPVGARLLPIREIKIHSRHPFAGHTVAEISDADHRILAVDDHWHPPPEHRVEAGQTVTVISARARARARRAPAAAPSA